MRKFVITLILAVLAVVAVDARTFALVVGVSNYGDEDVNLHQTTKDAKAMKKFLETQTNDITLLTSRYANRANIKEKLRAICNRAQKGDNIIFFYSGHGYPGGMYTYDGPLTYFDLSSILDSSEASLKVCYIDACHAGTALATQKDSSTDSEINNTRKDQVYLVGCRGQESSLESTLVGAGFFTRALLQGLRGKCDTNDDKEITVIELFKYVYGEVVRRSGDKQHPQLITPEAMKDAVVARWK